LVGNVSFIIGKNTTDSDESEEQMPVIPEIHDDSTKPGAACVSRDIESLHDQSQVLTLLAHKEKSPTVILLSTSKEGFKGIVDLKKKTAVTERMACAEDVKSFIADATEVKASEF